MRPAPLASCTLLATISACGGTPVGHTVGPPAPNGECTYDTQTFFGEDGETPIGLTATQALTIITGERLSTLSWDHLGEVTDLTFEFVPEAEQVEWNVATWEPAYPGAEPDLGDPSCEDFLGASGTLRFVTADSRLDEALGLTVRIHESGGFGRIDHTVPYESLAGSLEPMVIDLDEAWARIDVEFAVNLSNDSLSGELALYAERSETGEVEGYDLARWPMP